MRPVWSTLVAVALVVAGVRVGSAQASATGHSELHAAKCAHVAQAVRRGHAQARPLDALVAPRGAELPAVARQILPVERAAAVAQPIARALFARSSRGPPRA